MDKVSRKINWVSALDKNQQEKLAQLQEKMQAYYSKSDTYYTDIDFTYNVWSDTAMLPQLDIIEILTNKEKILEVGCGKANILLSKKFNEYSYTGVDFSEELLAENRERYPEATFYPI